MKGNVNPASLLGAWPRFPWSAAILPGAVVASFCLELGLGHDLRQNLFESFGLNPLLVRQGQWDLLLSYTWLHGSLTGAAINAVLILLFSPPVIRAFGGGVRGWLALLIAYEVIGAAAAGLFCLLHGRDNLTVVGASAAACGLMGAAARLPWAVRDGTIGEGRVLAIVHPRVLGLTGLFLACQMAVLLIAGHQGGAIAWDIHLIAYALGFILISPTLGLLHH